MKPTKLEVVVQNQEELIRRLMNILIMHAGNEQSNQISRLWDDYQDVLKGIDKDYEPK